MSFFKSITKPFKKLINKSVDLGKTIFPTLIGYGTGGWGGAAAAAMGTLGGMEDAKQYEKNQQQQIAWEREQYNKNYQAQKEFAQYGVRWRAADARKAGISPLAAFGMQSPGYSAIVGGNPYAGGFDQSEGDAYRSMGQDISRAVMARSSAKERAQIEARNAAIADLQLRNLQLQNESIEIDNSLRISKAVQGYKSPGTPPASPDSLTGQVEVLPSQIYSKVAGRPEQQAGEISDYQLADTNMGRARVPSQAAKNAIEDNLIQEIFWSVRNQLLPALGVGIQEPLDSPGKGYTWVYNPIFQTWSRRKGSKPINYYHGPGD